MAYRPLGRRDSWENGSEGEFAQFFSSTTFALYGKQCHQSIT